MALMVSYSFLFTHWCCKMSCLHKVSFTFRPSLFDQCYRVQVVVRVWFSSSGETEGQIASSSKILKSRHKQAPICTLTPTVNLDSLVYQIWRSVEAESNQLGPEAMVTPRGKALVRIEPENFYQTMLAPHIITWLFRTNQEKCFQCKEVLFKREEAAVDL